MIWSTSARSAARGANGSAHRGKRFVGVAAQRRDGGNANHDDESQHDCIFDSRRAIFGLQELDNRVGQDSSSFSMLLQKE